MTVEHLLLALLDNPSAQAVLKACGADAERLRQELEQAIEARCPAWPKMTAVTPSRPWASSGCCSGPCTTCSPRARRRSPAPTCWSPSSAKGLHAVYYLNQQDVTRLDVVNYLSHGIAKLGEEGEQPSSSSEGEGRMEGGRASRRAMP